MQREVRARRSSLLIGLPLLNCATWLSISNSSSQSDEGISVPAGVSVVARAKLLLANHTVYAQNSIDKLTDDLVNKLLDVANVTFQNPFAPLTDNEAEETKVKQVQAEPLIEDANQTNKDEKVQAEVEQVHVRDVAASPAAPPSLKELEEEEKDLENWRRASTEEREEELDLGKDEELTERESEEAEEERLAAEKKAAERAERAIKKKAREERLAAEKKAAEEEEKKEGLRSVPDVSYTSPSPHTPPSAEEFSSSSPLVTPQSKASSLPPFPSLPTVLSVPPSLTHSTSLPSAPPGFSHPTFPPPDSSPFLRNRSKWKKIIPCLPLLPSTLSNLGKWMRYRKKLLKELANPPHAIEMHFLTFVVGKEAPDADSIIASITYAYLKDMVNTHNIYGFGESREEESRENVRIFFPVIKWKRRYMQFHFIRHETFAILRSSGVDPCDLILTGDEEFEPVMSLVRSEDPAFHVMLDHHSQAAGLPRGIGAERTLDHQKDQIDSLEVSVSRNPNGQSLSSTSSNTMAVKTRHGKDQKAHDSSYNLAYEAVSGGLSVPLVSSACSVVASEYLKLETGRALLKEDHGAVASALNSVMIINSKERGQASHFEEHIFAELSAYVPVVKTKEGEINVTHTGLRALWDRYVMWLDRQPVIAKSVTSAVIGGAGEVLDQCVKLMLRGTFDPWRLLRFVLLNLVLVGPVIHYWYMLLYKLMPRGGPLWAVLRMAPDQLIFSPCFNFVFLSSLFTLTARKFQFASIPVWWKACKVNWCLWPPCQILNFWVIPQKLQVGFINLVALIWNTYLASVPEYKQVPIVSPENSTQPSLVVNRPAAPHPTPHKPTETHKQRTRHQQQKQHETPTSAPSHEKPHDLVA